MADAPFVAERTIGPGDNRITLRFEWHGGAYVDVRRKGSGVANEVINVWNSGSDTPRIERTQEALAERVDRWIKEYSDDDEPGSGELALYHDVTVNWMR